METARNERQVQIRKNAEMHLRSGTAPRTLAAGPVGVESLALLHDLASAPTTAGDALKLLHELQVHQVELDLQHEQGESDRDELADALQRQAEWFDHLPCACLALDDDGRLQALNRGAVAWLDGAAAKMPAALAEGAPAGWLGRHLPDLLADESRAMLHEALRHLRGGAARASCRLRLLQGTADIEVMATLPPGGHAVLLAWLPGADDR